MVERQYMIFMMIASLYAVIANVQTLCADFWGAGQRHTLFGAGNVINSRVQIQVQTSVWPVYG